MRICLDCREPIGTEWVCDRCGWAPARIDGYPAFAPEMAGKCEGFNAQYHLQLASLLTHCFWFRGRSKLVLWALEEFFPAARSFLEVGCGTGDVLATLAGSRPELALVGGDMHVEALRLASPRVDRAVFIQVDARSLPYQEEFDVLGAFDVLEHVDKDQVALGEFFRSARRGGGIIVTVPQHPTLWSRWDEFSAHQRRYTRQALIRRVEAAGFRVRWMTSFMTLLFPALLASRVALALRATPTASSDLFPMLRLPRFLDRYFERICDLEKQLLTKRVSLPLGGSLLCVGVKP